MPNWSSHHSSEGNRAIIMAGRRRPVPSPPATPVTTFLCARASFAPTQVSPTHISICSSLHTADAVSIFNCHKTVTPAAWFSWIQLTRKRMLILSIRWVISGYFALLGSSLKAGVGEKNISMGLYWIYWRKVTSDNPASVFLQSMCVSAWEHQSST